MDARCPKCEKVAVLSDDITNVKCPHCGFEASYDSYIDIMKENDANPLVGVNIGNDVDATTVGLSGKMKITGGSDKSGVPMRADIHGGARKYVLLSKGVGLNNAEKGERVRKLVRGNTISEEIYQINCRFDGEIKIEKTPEADYKVDSAKEAPKKDDSAKKEVKGEAKKA